MGKEELSPKNIDILNKTLIAGIKSEREEYRDVIKKNLNILLDNLDSIEETVTGEQIMQLEQTMRLLKDMLYLNSYPLLTSLIKKAWDLLGQFLIKTSKKRRFYVYPKSAYYYQGKKYPYPYGYWRRYYEKYGKVPTQKKIFEYHLNKISRNPEAYIDRYYELENLNWNRTLDTIEDMEEQGFYDAMKYILNERLKIPEYLTSHDIVHEGVEKLLLELEQNTKRVVQKIKETPKEEIAQLSREEDLKKLFEKVANLLIAEERKSHREEWVRLE